MVNGDAGSDTVNVYSTDAGSISTLNGDAGTSVLNVRAMDGPVEVHGVGDNDTVNVASLGRRCRTARGQPTGPIDDINALLTVDGGSGDTDVMNIDDSAAATNNKSRTLTGDRWPASARGPDQLPQPQEAQHLARVPRQHIDHQQHAHW